MRYLFALLTLLATLLGITGCARFPENMVTPDAPPRTIYSEITVDGIIDPNAYYFFALGTDQTNATGPVPVVAGYGYTGGWGTISDLLGGEVEQPPFFVEIHGSVFQQYRNGQPIGPPYRYGIEGQRLWVEIDQRELEPLLPTITDATIVQLNWITMREISPEGEPIPNNKEFDAFGGRGQENSYLGNVTLLTSRTWISGEGATIIEQSNDTTTDSAIDMTGWRVEVRVGSGTPTP